MVCANMLTQYFLTYPVPASIGLAFFNEFMRIRKRQLRSRKDLIAWSIMKSILEAEENLLR